MSKKRVFLVAAAIFLMLMGLAAYDVSRLQTGLEQPTEAVIAAANAAVRGQTGSSTALGTGVPAITTYEAMTVPVVDDISVVVYVRESETAVSNLLLIHGAGGGAWVWEYYFDQFPAEFNLYAMSWRGHFDSTPVPDANSADYVVDQTAVFNAISQRNNLPIHLIGHSFGGATSILQAAQMPEQIASIHLLASVVPLDYSWLQARIVPRILPAIITRAVEADPQASSSFPDMFVADARMAVYRAQYASQPYSVEKPGLFPGDAFALAWQDRLAAAYAQVGAADLPVWMLVARYDNVVRPADQLAMAASIGAVPVELDSGHYIQLDWLVAESADLIINHLFAAGP